MARRRRVPPQVASADDLAVAVPEDDQLLAAVPVKMEEEQLAAIAAGHPAVPLVRTVVALA
eukprot:11221984-Lingulodinium_polyedra.AAC.1